MGLILGGLRLAWRYWLVWLVAAASTLVGIGLSGTERGRQFELASQQSLQKRFDPLSASRRVVLVKITKGDLPMTPSGPSAVIPRHLHAELINRLKEAGASVVVFDLLFDSRPQPTEDPPFREAILHSSPLSVTLCQAPTDQVRDENAPNEELDSFLPPAFLPSQLPPNVQLGQSQAVSTGAISGSIQLVCKDQRTGRYVENIALLAYRQLFRLPVGVVDLNPDNSHVSVGTQSIQIGPDEDFLIDWQAGDEGPDTLTYSKALATLRAGDPEHVFKGKAVVVGNLLADPTVLTASGEKAGVQMVAQALNTLIRTKDKPVLRLPQEYGQRWAALLAILMSLATSLRRPKRVFTFSLLTFGIALLTPAALLVSGAGLLLVLPALIACISAAVLGFAARGLLRGWYPMPRIGVVEATVLVVDIKDSTPLFERLGSREGSELISRALDVASRAVTEEHGEVIHHTGDGFIAVFQAAPASNHSAAAIRAALHIVGRPVEESGVEFRAGIESGMLDQGHRGLQGLPFHYATRLEGLCATEGQKLLIGPSAAAYSSEIFRLESIGPRTLKGIRLPIAPFRLANDQN